MRRLRNLLLLAVFAPAMLTGCYPLAMGLFTPIFIPPWTAERMEEKYCNPNDFRTPILPPIKPGSPPPLCLDEPDDSRILRALPRVTRGVPYFYEEFRDDISFVKELIVDKIDPPRFFPLVGPAQLHHCHWKCTVFYTETIESGYPFPYRCRKPVVKVVYIDLDHLHAYVGDKPEAQRAVFRDFAGP